MKRPRFSTTMMSISADKNIPARLRRICECEQAERRRRTRSNSGCIVNSAPKATLFMAPKPPLPCRTLKHKSSPRTLCRELQDRNRPHPSNLSRRRHPILGDYPRLLRRLRNSTQSLMKNCRVGALADADYTRGASGGPPSREHSLASVTCKYRN